MTVGRYLAGVIERYLPQVAEPIKSFFDGLVAPLARIFSQYSNATPVEGGTVATGAAALLVLMKAGGAYFLMYTLVGLIKPAYDMNQKQRHGISAVLFSISMVISGMWPLDLFAKTKARTATVLDMMLRGNPDVRIDLATMVWDIHLPFLRLNFGPRLDFAVVLMLAIVALSAIAGKMGGVYHVKIVSGGSALASAVLYTVLSVAKINVFPIPAKIAFAVQAAAVLAVLYAVTWIGSMSAVYFVRFLESFHVRDPPDAPPRHKVVTGALMLGVFLSVFGTVRALLTWFGVLVYIAGGGWDLAYRLAGGEKREKEVCKVRDDGTQVCRTESEWDVKWKNNSNDATTTNKESDMKWDS